MNILGNITFTKIIKYLRKVISLLTILMKILRVANIFLASLARWRFISKYRNNQEEPPYAILRWTLACLLRHANSHRASLLEVGPWPQHKTELSHYDNSSYIYQAVCMFSHKVLAYSVLFFIMLFAEDLSQNSDTFRSLKTFMMQGIWCWQLSSVESECGTIFCFVATFLSWNCEEAAGLTHSDTASSQLY